MPKAVALPLARISPGEAVSEKSSPPQTPSPAASPQIMPTMRSGSPTLKIPLKYQRQSKVKHYKKKFRDRKWEYDDYAEPEVFVGSAMESRVSSQLAADDLVGDHNVAPMKTSKFRPKGKDWGRANHEEVTD